MAFESSRIGTLVISLLLLLKCGDIVAQSSGPLLKSHYPTRSFTQQLQGSSNQVWDMATDENGIIYLATVSGLVTNTYGFWEVHKPESVDNMFLKSVCVVNDTIWAAGTNSISLFIRDENGNFVISSNTEHQNGNFWNILSFQNYIYLHTEHVLLEYNRATKVYKKQNWSHRIHKIFTFRDKLYAIDDFGQLLYCNRTEMTVVDSIPALEGKEIREVLIKDNKLVIFALDGTIVSYDPEIKSSNIIQTKNINSEVFSANYLGEDRFLLGSIALGAIVTESINPMDLNNGLQPSNFIDENSGLDDNTIMTNLLDNNNQLWLGLNYGVAYSEVNSPYRTLFDGASISSLCVHNNQLYLGTNKGVYLCDGSSNRGQLIANTKGQVWHLQSRGDELLVCHNKGVFTLDSSNKQTGLWKFPGAISIKKVAKQSFLVSTYTEVLLLRTHNGEIISSERISDIPATKIVEGADPHKNDYYLVTNNSAIQCYIEFQENLEFKRIEFEAEEVFRVNNQVLTYKKNRLYTNRIAGDTIFFQPCNQEPFASIESDGISAIKSTSGGEHILVNSKGSLLLYSQQLDGTFIKYTQLFGRINGTLNTYGNGFDIVDDKVMLFSAQSLLSYNLNYRRQRIVDKPIVCSVSSSDGSGNKTSINYPSLLLNSSSTQFANIQFRFSANHLMYDKVEYAYRLSPDEESFSSWGSEQSIHFTNLSDGDYCLELKALINGEETQVTKTYFYVDGEWYEKPFGRAIEVLLFVFVVALIFYIRTRIITEKRANKMKEEHQSEMLSMKNEQATKFLARLEQKNAFLDKVSESLKRMNNERAKQLVNLIKEESAKESQGYLYYTFFADNHKDFIDSISKQFPCLTQNDLRLCLFIRLKLTSKDIASLMHISTSGVEKARYRLRKKLGINGEVDLATFINHVN